MLSDLGLYGGSRFFFEKSLLKKLFFEGGSFLMNIGLNHFFDNLLDTFLIEFNITQSINESSSSIHILCSGI